MAFFDVFTGKVAPQQDAHVSITEAPGAPDLLFHQAGIFLGQVEISYR